MSRLTCLLLLGSLMIRSVANSVPLFVQDSIPPVISCPPSVTLTLSAAACDTVYHYSVTAQDDEPGVIVAKVSGISSGQPFPAGVTTNLYIAVDASGNTATCSFSVQVNSNPPPSLVCRDMLTLPLGPACTAVLQANDFLLPPFGCDDAYLVEVDKAIPFGNGPWLSANFSPDDLGKTCQIRVQNLVSGNTCWGNVILVDTLPPALNCQTVQVPCALPSEHLLPSFLTDSLGITAGQPAAMDNCPGNTSLTFLDESLDLPCSASDSVTGAITRTWQVQDVSGNTATCVQTIQRVRSVANVFFPADTVRYCSAPDAAPEVTGGPFVEVGGRRYNLLTAPFCEIDAFYEDSLEATCGGGWRIRRVWDVRDACLPVGPNNPVFGTQYIEVRDTAAPIVQCPVDTVYHVFTDTNCFVALDLPDVVVRDACSPVADATAFWGVNGLTEAFAGTLENFTGNNPAESDTLAAFGTVPDFQTGITEILYVLTDACGNNTTCSFQVIVWDNVPPIPACKSIVQVYMDAQGLAILPAELADGGSTDACSDLYFKIRRDTIIGECDQTALDFTDWITLCCTEIDDTIIAVLRVYDILPPAGIVADTFAAGQFADCALSVVVLDTLGPACISPQDVTTSCESFVPTLGAYGFFTYSCSTDSTIEDVYAAQFDSVCKVGTIFRHFQVFDASGGKSSSCTQQIVVEPMPQHFVVRFPDDKVTTMCDSAGNYGTPLMLGQGCENLTATYTDEVIAVVPDACFRINRTWTVLNTCTYNPALPLLAIPNPNPSPSTNHSSNLPGPIVSAPNTPTPWAPTIVAISPGQTPTNYSNFWSANANGYTYKQTIKIIDPEDPVAIACPTGPVLLTDETDNDLHLWHEQYWLDPLTGMHNLCEGPADLCFTATDLCSGSDISIRYLLFLDLDGNGTVETVINSLNTGIAGLGWNTVPFGNANNPNYGGGTARAFDQRQVSLSQKYGFAIQTTTNGNRQTACVRWNTSSQKQSFVVPQLPYGTHRIRWIATDNCGNETTCEYVFTIQNNFGICDGVLIPLVGNVHTEAGDGIADVNVSLNRALTNQPPSMDNQTTDQDGDYTFQTLTIGSYTVKPERDVDHQNGVSTLDMLLINKHILGIDTLDSPYKMIAADANNSRSITTFDIVELRKLILGIYTEFPNNTSWRFVESKYVFPQPMNPFTAPFPETGTGLNPSPANPPVHNFVGVKVGDVNGNAIANATEPEMEERHSETVFLDIPDLQVQTGEELDLPVSVSVPVAGFQAVLVLSGLEVLDVAGLRAEHFAVFPQEERIAFSWTGEAQPAMTLRLRATTGGRLRERVRLTNEIARPEAYLPKGRDFQTHALALRFDGIPGRPAGLELFQNQPNPFGSATEFGFYLPKAETAKLQVFDMTGRLCFTYTSWYPAGTHRFVLKKEMLLGATGVLYYTLETNDARAVRKCVLR